MDTAQLGAAGGLQRVFPPGVKTLAIGGPVMPRVKQMVIVRRAANGFIVMEEGSPTDTWMVSKLLNEMTDHVKDMFVEEPIQNENVVLPEEGV